MKRYMDPGPVYSVLFRRCARVIFICLFLTVLVGAAARAEERRLSPDGRFEYVLKEDGTAAIADWIENSVSIEVPAEVDGHPVTAIESYSFQDLYYAEALRLPEGITTIRDHAFSGFWSLKRMNLPASVVSVGVNPWVNCSDLTALEIEGDDPRYFISGGCLYDREHTLIACLEGLCAGDTVQVLPGTGVIGERAFFGGSGRVRHVALPEGIEEIGAWALTYLDEVELPSTVRVIGDFAFSGCKMKEISLPGGVRSVGANPFVGCDHLAAVHIGEGNPRYRVFENALCDMDTHTLIAWLPDCGETDPVVPEGTLAIGSRAFYFADIDRIDLPEGLQAIGEEAFFSCRVLKEIRFPSSLRSVGEAAFGNCSSLRVPPFPDGLREIGSHAFRFVSWTGPVVLPDGLTALGNDPFAGCDLPFGIEVSRDNGRFIAENGFLYDALEGRLIKCFSDAERVTVPDGIRRVGAYAFWQNDVVRHVELPASVEYIDPFAFDGCAAMESIVFSPNLKVIGSYAFTDCDALTEIRLPETLTLIDTGGFSFCPALKEVTLAGDRAYISPSAFFDTDARIMGPDGEIEFTVKKNLPLF